MSEPIRPSPARPRHDGWTPARQLAFLGALSLTRCVTRSAAAAGMSRKSAYRLRGRPDGALFAARWDQILRSPHSPSPAPRPGHESHAFRAYAGRRGAPLPASGS